MKTLLWLDDYRNPFDEKLGWVKLFSPIRDSRIEVFWAKNYEQFVTFIEMMGLPDAICFDHDLGFTNEYYVENGLESPEPDKTGYDCAKWLIEYCLNNNKELPLYNIQSSNPVGKENIDGLLKSFKRFKDN